MVKVNKTTALNP